MKIKSKTKKIIVLSVMVALLIATGVLNFVLSDKLGSSNQTSNGNTSTVTQTFFAAAKSLRSASAAMRSGAENTSLIHIRTDQRPPVG